MSHRESATPDRVKVVEPRRLCFVVESGTDVRLVEGLAERYALTVVARRIEGGVEISHPPSMPVDVEFGPSSRLGFGQFLFRYLAERARAFDFILVQGYGVAALAANLAARRAGVPAAMLVCSPAEAYYLCRRDARQNGRRFHRSELWAIRGLALINARIGRRYVVLSNYLADVVWGHGARGPVEVVPVYGVDTRIFRPAPESKAELKVCLGIPPSAGVIFFSSRIAPEKDAGTLLTAFRQLRDSGRDLWLLHRSGGYQDFLEAARAFGVSERVLATDAVHPHRQLPLDYQASDVCVQAGRAEGLGFSPLEALACGVPVVAAATGGLKETVRDGETGWSYPVGDPDRLAACIAEILDDPAEAARRAVLGREMVCRRFGREAAFEALANVIALASEGSTTVQPVRT